MIISKLELERYIEEYKVYLKDNDEATFYFTNRDYLNRNGANLDMLDIIEKLVVMVTGQDQIEQVLVVLGVEVR
jgi:ribosome biogenesis protein Nip4